MMKDSKESRKSPHMAINVAQIAIECLKLSTQRIKRNTNSEIGKRVML